jgi:hypothetical protein
MYRTITVVLTSRNTSLMELSYLTSLFVSSLTQITLGGEESGYFKKGQVQGDSHDVGAVVVYCGRECTVTGAPDSYGYLKLRYPPFTLTADMVEIDLSGCGVGSPEAVLTAAFMKEKCG